LPSAIQKSFKISVVFVCTVVSPKSQLLFVQLRTELQAVIGTDVCQFAFVFFTAGAWFSQKVN